LPLRSLPGTNLEVGEKVRVEANYFEKDPDRMPYPKFRRQHLFVGSGVIEAGCKTVIGSRLKQSGMFRTCVEPTRSWLFAAVSLTVVSKITGCSPGGITVTFMSRTLAMFLIWILQGNETVLVTV
jgi:hypothetical protein